VNTEAKLSDCPNLAIGILLPYVFVCHKDEFLVYTLNTYTGFTWTDLGP